MTIYTFGFQTYMVISAQCESCGQYFTLPHTLTHRSNNYFQKGAEEEANAILLKEVEQRKQAQDYGMEKCPNCGHYQSWMRRSIQAEVWGKTRRAAIIALWLVALSTFCDVFLLTDRLSDSLAISWPVALTMLLLVMLLIPTIPTIIVYLYVSEKYANKTADDQLQPHSPKISVNSNLGSAFTLLANAYLQEKNSEQALAHFNRAIEAEPRLAGAYGGRGMVLLRQQRTEAALGDLKHYLSLAGASASPQIVQLVQRLESGEESNL